MADGPGSEELVITGGGTTLVATDAMLAYLDRLRLLVEDLEAARQRLRGADRRADWWSIPGAPVAAQYSESMIDDACEAVRCATERAESLREAVELAARIYTRTEKTVEEWQSAAQGIGAAMLAPVARTAAVLALPALGWTALALAAAPGSPEQKLEKLQRFLLDHPEIVTNPMFVDAVRGIAEHGDEFAWATVAPGPLAALLGSEGLGLTGVETNAIGVLAAGGALGLFRESDVAVTRVGAATGAAAAQGSAERLDRVPEVDQVRIERYEAPGLPPRYVVYVGPTETFSPAPSGEPWDLTSNVGGVAGLPVASLRATELAMADAGIDSSSEVQLVGFSQGALVATRIAASDHWNAQGLETYAGPTGNIPLDPGLSGMAVRHTDDFVPALAGEQQDERRLQVERRAHPDGGPEGVAAPAHQKAAYAETARQIDEAASPQVRRQVEAMDAFTAEYTDRAGSETTVFRYRAERVGETRALVGPG